MSEPMTAKQFTDLLTEWNIPFTRFNDTWSSHNRNKKGPWGPVNGVMLHHTGSDTTKGMATQLWNGYPTLPGPLCHAGIAKDGRLWLVGWGRTNHAGGGDPVVLNQVINEKYTSLRPRYTDSDDEAIDGNSHFYGFEIMYSGSHAMTPEQMSSVTSVAAAICRHHKWSAKSAIGHGEWQRGKWDPGISSGKLYNMEAIRDVIALKIKNGPRKTEPPKRTMRKVTVKPGDSVYRIAERELKDATRWPEIAEANPKLFPMTILPGTQLYVPEK